MPHERRRVVLRIVRFVEEHRRLRALGSLLLLLLVFAGLLVLLTHIVVMPGPPLEP